MIFVTNDSATMRYDGTSALLYNIFGREDWSVLRKRSRLYLSTNRGMTTFAWTDKRPERWDKLSRWLNARYANPWSAAGAALREMLQLSNDTITNYDRPPCIHYRATRMLAAPLQNVMTCALRQSPGARCRQHAQAKPHPE